MPKQQMDCDYSCQMSARRKSKKSGPAGVAKIVTVDSPVPYLLSDLTTILQNGNWASWDQGDQQRSYQRLKSEDDEIRRSS